MEETAQVVDVSVSKVKRDWSMAKAWLYKELNQKPASQGIRT